MDLSWVHMDLMITQTPMWSIIFLIKYYTCLSEDYIQNDRLSKFFPKIEIYWRFANLGAHSYQEMNLVSMFEALYYNPC
jgi:hypothetical protein